MPLEEVDTARLESENNVGTGLLVGLGIAAGAAAIGAMSADNEGWFGDPGSQAAILGILIGGPAVLIGLISGIATSHSEQSITPENDSWISEMKGNSHFPDATPVELDSLNCNSRSIAP